MPLVGPLRRQRIVHVQREKTPKDCPLLKCPADLETLTTRQRHAYYLEMVMSRVHGLRWVCSVLLMATGVAFLLVDSTGCAKHRLPDGLSNLKPCRVEGV